MADQAAFRLTSELRFVDTLLIERVKHGAQLRIGRSDLNDGALLAIADVNVIAEIYSARCFRRDPPPLQAGLLIDENLRFDGNL